MFRMIYFTTIRFILFCSLSDNYLYKKNQGTSLLDIFSLPVHRHKKRKIRIKILFKIHTHTHTQTHAPKQVIQSRNEKQNNKKLYNY